MHWGRVGPAIPHGSVAFFIFALAKNCLHGYKIKGFKDPDNLKDCFRPLLGYY